MGYLEDEYFNNTLSRDLFRLICGEKIGSGVAREVYVYNLNPEYVVKIETLGCSFQNVVEWGAWDDFSEVKSVAKWLAPCLHISPCGTILVQRRTDPIGPSEAPKRMPKFLTDFKYSNYGRLDGKIVCHDYGTLIYDLDERLKAADWWSP